MRVPKIPELNRESDLRHRIRDLRFFEESFRRNVTLTLAGESLTSKTDQARLRSSFLAWLETFHETRHLADIDRRDFICFSAGRMLAELVRYDPLSVAASKSGEKDGSGDWPVGAAYVSYCLGVAMSVMEQEFNFSSPLPDLANDPRVWQSFQENVRDNPDLAIPFLDLLLGQAPNWSEPSLAEQRPAVKAKTNLAIEN